MNMAYTPKGSRTGWVQQPMAWWGVAAHGGQGLWSLVGPGLALAIPTCSRWWGWRSPWPPSCPEAGGAHSAAESWDTRWTVPGETPGAAMGGCPHHIWRPLTVNLLVEAFSSMGFTKHGGTQMQITQRCPSGDKTEVLVLVLVVIHTMPLVHPHFTLCLLGAALLMFPVPRLVSIVPAATLRAWHPTTTGGSMAPASLSSASKPGAGQGHSAFHGEGQGEAPGSLQRVFCTNFLSHCWSCPSQAQWVWSSCTIRLQYHLHATFHISPRNPEGRMVAAVLQAGDTATGEGPRCASGFALGRDGEQRQWDMQLKGVMLKNKKNHPCL